MEKNYQGLKSSEAEALLGKYGLNAIPRRNSESALSLYLSQLKNPLIFILIIASIITIILNDHLDTIVILSAVIINSLLGFLQEYRAKKTLETLTSLLSEKSKVLRDKTAKEINSKQIVPGDIVYLSAGDKIPADGRVLESINILVNESILTGESLALIKNIDDKVFAGTSVLSGRGIIIIEKTGANTEIGKIADELQKEKEEKTPLQKKLETLGKELSFVVIVLSGLVFSFGLLRGENSLSIFKTSLAVAVSAIPEGLAVSLTAILSIGMQRILKRKAIVRKLISAETLGSVSLIVTDKTGTLTEGRMRVTESFFTDKNIAVKAATLANNTETPIELALWDWVRGLGVDPDLLNDYSKRAEEIPFNSESKFMAVKIGDEIFTKGAPEIIAGMCSLNKEEKENIETTHNKYSKEGLHMIALGYKKILSDEKLETSLNNLTFVGLIGATDPVRASVKDAIENCLHAGIKTVVVTGDYQKTAEFVMEKIGLKIENPSEEIIDGKELEEMSDDDLTKRIGKIKLFARVSPHQKLIIVKAFKKCGETVAVTGDGVNDALALKEADIGIVVHTASDVAKETADIVLLDSNFRTIVAAVEEGRGIYDNIRRVTLYLISDVFSGITIIGTSLFLGIPLPLTAAQILWINIISDGLPTLALTTEPKSRFLMTRPPKNPNEPLLDSQMKSLIVIISLASGLFSVGIFILYYSLTNNLALARTMAFTLQAVNSLIYVFAARALTKPIYKVNLFKNPFLIVTVVIGFLLQFSVIYTPQLRNLFNTTQINFPGWLLILFSSICVALVIEVTKAIFRKTKSF